MISTSNFSRGGPYTIRGKVIFHQFVNSDIVNLLLKVKDGRYRRPDFAIWTASYAPDKNLEGEGSISSSHFYGQLLFTRFLAIFTQ